MQLIQTDEGGYVPITSIARTEPSRSKEHVLLYGHTDLYLGKCNDIELSGIRELNLSSIVPDHSNTVALVAWSHNQAVTSVEVRVVTGWYLPDWVEGMPRPCIQGLEYMETAHPCDMTRNDSHYLIGLWSPSTEMLAVECLDETKNCKTLYDAKDALFLLELEYLQKNPHIDPEKQA